MSPMSSKINGWDDDRIPSDVIPSHNLSQVMHEEVAASHVHGRQVEIQYAGIGGLKQEFNK